MQTLDHTYRPLLVVGLLLMLSLTGWFLFHQQPAKAPAKPTPTQAYAASVAPQIHSSEDFGSALQTLDANDPVASNDGDISRLANHAGNF